MPTPKTQRAALGCLVTVLAAAVPAGAAITSLTLNKCLSGKVKGVGKSVSARTKCASKEASSGVPNPACTQKASDKFTGDGTPAKGVFNKLEARYPLTNPSPCRTFSDQTPFEGDIASYAASIPATTGSAVGQCDAAKIKCVGKYVAAITNCYAKAAKVTGTVDAACITKATTKFTGTVSSCLDKAAARGDCTHAGTQVGPLQADADAFIKVSTCDLDPGNPGCGCPSSYAFTANGPDADLDVGWTGINHDGDVTSGSRVTLAVSGCPNTVSPCGTCALSGPLPNGGGASFDNHRCRGDNTGANGSWLPCTSDADCTGTGNACVFFLGPPRPDHLGFGELCTLTEIGSVSGTIDPDSGTLSMGATIVTHNYAGLLIDDPCPLCTGGLCSGGPRMNMSCVVQGHSTSFDDDVSLDCPPSAGAGLPPLSATVTLTTGTQTLTLAASSPACRAVGHTGQSCFCDTCNNGNAEPCLSDATCPISGGNPGICGGKRCLGGSNAGTPCAVTSECPGAPCGRAGAPSAPNQCDDGICTPNSPPDGDSPHEGTCAGGPFEGSCALQPYRGCAMATDCPLAGDSCVTKFRDCFTTDGVVGDTVSATGQASAATPTLTALYCGPPSSASTVNQIRGLPGLVRLTIPGVAQMD
jgi:hypothetical protein